MNVVLHIITGLNTGGAERALYNVIQGGPAERYQTVVISLTDEGRYGTLLKKLGVPVHCLGMKRGLPSFSALLRLRKIIRMHHPDVIQGWMYHGNLLASLACFFSSKSAKAIWNVRHCLYDLRDEKRLTQWIVRLCKILSVTPAAIIYNSHVSRSQHEQFGYSPIRGLIIPNGFDLGRFARSKDVRTEVRRELFISRESFVFGHVGRFHPMKDHACFLQAAVIVAKQNTEALFLLVGTEIDDQNQQLLDLIPDQFRERFLLLGERSDVHRLYSAMDAFCLSSFSEAFPNVLGEAMSSSLPCITTDVGDAANVVGETGLIVPPRDPNALANAMIEMLIMSDDARRASGKAAQKRVKEKYSLISIIDKYVDLYDELLFTQ